MGLFDFLNVKRAERVSPHAAKNRLQSEKNILLVDVRTPSEYISRHIPGSILIPLDTIKIEAPKKLTNQDATIFVYCLSGGRSASAAQILLSMGYTNVFDMGGISSWPYETETGS